MWEKLWRFILPKILQADVDPSLVTESHSAATCQLHIFFFLPMTLAWGVETILWLWKIWEPLKAPNLLIDYIWLSWWSWSILKNHQNGTSPIFRRRLRQSRSQGGLIILTPIWSHNGFTQESNIPNPRVAFLSVQIAMKIPFFKHT